MATVTAEKFIELVSRSELADADRLRAALEKIRADHAGELPTDVVALAKALQREKIITRWHTEKLLQGKYKGFFLGKYKLLGHIGSGGMSSVYLAEHTKMNDLRAIKVLPPSKMSKSSYLARFQQEAKAIASLNHPNIVRAYDIDNQGDIHYIVMEYVHGKDLQSIVKKNGPLPFEQVADYIAQAAHGLQHAHDMGLIHRDVKPANMLIRKDGRLKLLDLGLALYADESQASLTIDHNDKVLGTADYLAPEQALNSHGVDRRADLYGLGCTMYYLLTGNPPFPTGSIAQRIAKHQKEMPQEIRKLRADCPGELEGICWKLMQKDPAYRYATAEQTAEVLEAWLARHQQPDRVSAVAGHGAPLRLGEDSGLRGGSSLSHYGSRTSDIGSHMSDSGSRTSGMGSAMSDTLNNRGGDTLSGRSGSIITNLSSSDSGVLVRLANSSSSGSQIDLQAEMKPPGRPGSDSSFHDRPAGKSPAPRTSTAARPGTGLAGSGQTRRPHPIRPPSTVALPAEPKKRLVWIAGLIVMFILAVLLGVVIARLADSHHSPPAVIEESN